MAKRAAGTPGVVVVTKLKKAKGVGAGGVRVRHPEVAAALREMNGLAEVAPTPVIGGAAGKARTTAGGEMNDVKNVETFLTCGEPAGTVPTADPCDRAHGWAPGGTLLRGDRVGRMGGTLARRYPRGQMSDPKNDGKRLYSIDTQMEAQAERERMLASWGVAGYGVDHAVDQVQQELRNALFAHRSDEATRRVLRLAGVSKVVRGVGDAPEGGW